MNASRAMRARTLLAVLAALSMAGPAAARQLELGFGLNPTMIQDPAYEAFSSADLSVTRVGLDLRYEIADLGRGLSLIPLVGYRYSSDEGRPLQALDTRLEAHDFLAALRLRARLGSWYGLFAEIQGGLLWVSLEADAVDGWYRVEQGARNRYSDDRLTWQAGGLAGIEVWISRARLERNKPRRFGFGGEFGAGYLRRGELEFVPELNGGDDLSLPMSDPLSWGTVNLSGWFFQLAAVVTFR